MAKSARKLIFSLALWSEWLCRQHSGSKWHRSAPALAKGPNEQKFQAVTYLPSGKVSPQPKSYTQALQCLSNCQGRGKNWLTLSLEKGINPNKWGGVGASDNDREALMVCLWTPRHSLYGPGRKGINHGPRNSSLQRVMIILTVVWAGSTTVKMDEKYMFMSFLLNPEL